GVPLRGDPTGHEPDNDCQAAGAALALVFQFDRPLAARRGFPHCFLDLLVGYHWAFSLFMTGRDLLAVLLAVCRQLCPPGAASLSSAPPPRVPRNTVNNLAFAVIIVKHREANG